jgi:hypothetical protein
MIKFLTLSILITFFLSCGLNSNDKKVEGTNLTTEEEESAVIIRDYFKKMNTLSESDLSTIKALDVSLLIENNDTFQFNRIQM